MAAISAHKSWEQSADETRANGRNSWNLSWTEKWTVVCDNMVTAIADAMDFASVPQQRVAHSQKGGIYVVSRSPKTIGPFLVEITIGYDGENSPLLAPYERQVTTTCSRETVETYWDAETSTEKLLVNAAGDRYTVEEDIYDLVYTVTRNEATYPWAIRRAYFPMRGRGALNEDAYKDHQPGEAKITNIDGTYVPDGDNYYYRMTYVIAFRSGGWKHHTFNEGFRYLTAGGKPVNATDANGQTVSRQIPLASDGTKLAVGGTHVYLDREGSPRLNFAALGLG